MKSEQELRHAKMMADEVEQCRVSLNEAMKRARTSYGLMFIISTTQDGSVEAGPLPLHQVDIQIMMPR